MSFLTRIMRHFSYEKRSDPSWDAVSLLSAKTPVGRAESISACYACVSAISETIASLPLILYRRTDDDGRERAKDHPLYRVLHDQANDKQTALEFREQMQAFVLLRGNAYAEIIRDYAGQATALFPIHPDRVSVIKLENGRLAYETADSKGNVKRLLQHEVFHLRHRSENGILGVSPIRASRETFDLALAERDHGIGTFTNGSKLTGVFKYPGFLNQDQRKQLRESWETQHSGGKNAGKIAVLERGMEFQPISMTLEDAEWVAARQFSVEEVARLFRVPPTVIGDLRHGNYSNSVEMNRQFVTHTLRRHIAMWESSISMSLLTQAGRRIYFAEHSVEGLLRGDSTNRADFYSKALNDGWMDIDEVRKLENLPVRKHETAQTAEGGNKAAQETKEEDENAAS